MLREHFKSEKSPINVTVRILTIISNAKGCFSGTYMHQVRKEGKKMDLSEIRKEIDSIDDELLALFLKRMELCNGVAKYKKENNMAVFQRGREDDILQRMQSKSPDRMKKGTRLFYRNIMDISKSIQQQLLTEIQPYDFVPVKNTSVSIACPGASGSNTEQACKKLFSDSDIKFYPEFADVFEAVDKGEADYGVLPIENSTAGEVSQTYRLLSNYDFYICKSTDIKITHCLAAKSGSEIKKIYSHEQALMQCSGFIRNGGYVQSGYANTALAAEMVANSDDNTIGAICSPECAKLYGLEIIADDIGDNKDNKTRFICISKRPEIEENADTISICLSLPNTSGSLYAMLTKFAYYGLNLTKIESAPVPETWKDSKTDAFDVIFYLDFEGSVKSEDVNVLMRNLEKDMRYYKFLGNYRHVK